MKKQQIICPECKAKNSINMDIQVGEVITCQDCNTDLEFIQLKPLKVELAPEAKEDWGE